ADLDQIRVVQVVPANEVFPVLAVVEADANQRVAGPYRVVAGARAAVERGGLAGIGGGSRSDGRARCHDRGPRRRRALLDRRTVRWIDTTEEADDRDDDARGLQGPPSRGFDHEHGTFSIFIRQVL